MVGIGFCEECYVRIFADCEMPYDYVMEDGKFVCSECMSERESDREANS